MRCSMLCTANGVNDLSYDERCVAFVLPLALFPPLKTLPSFSQLPCSLFLSLVFSAPSFPLALCSSLSLSLFTLLAFTSKFCILLVAHSSSTASLALLWFCYYVPCPLRLSAVSRGHRQHFDVVLSPSHVLRVLPRRRCVRRTHIPMRVLRECIL